MGRKETSRVVTLCVRRVLPPHTIAALSNSRMHSHVQSIIAFSTVRLFPANHSKIFIFLATLDIKLSTLTKSLSSHQIFALSKLLNPYLIYVNGICHLSNSSSTTIYISSFSTLSVFERVVGLSLEIVSVGLWSVRRIFQVEYTAHEGAAALIRPRL